MYLPEIEIHEAATLEEAGSLLSRYAPDVRSLAGGTDLLVDLKTGRIRVGHVVSLDQIAPLHGISLRENCVRIGSLTTISELLVSTIIHEHAAPLVDAASQMAAVQIRNVATVGGNIASAVPCADLPPILIAMKATVTVWNKGTERAIPLEDFFTGPRQTVMQPDEVLMAVEIPKTAPGWGACYERFSLRDGNSIAVASVAVALSLDDDHIVQDARIVLGAVAPTPIFIEAAGNALTGGALDEESIASASEEAMNATAPICDIRGSAEFRRELIGVLTPRAIEKARHRAQDRR